MATQAEGGSAERWMRRRWYIVDCVLIGGFLLTYAGSFGFSSVTRYWDGLSNGGRPMLGLFVFFGLGAVSLGLLVVLARHDGLGVGDHATESALRAARQDRDRSSEDPPDLGRRTGPLGRRDRPGGHGDAADERRKKQWRRGRRVSPAPGSRGVCVARTAMSLSDDEIPRKDGVG